MKPIKSLLVLAIMLAPGLAGAQGYYGPNGPPPTRGGFHHRMGRISWGGSVGLGFMHDDGGDITCNNCDYNPASGMIQGHIGIMLSDQFALLGEVQVNGQTLNASVYGNTTLINSALMIAGQYWLTPQFWLKAGIGPSHLDVQDDFNGTYAIADTGFSIMAAAGFEVLSARFLAVDLEGRLLEGTYHGIGDHVTVGTVGVGINWY